MDWKKKPRDTLREKMNFSCRFLDVRPGKLKYKKLIMEYYQIGKFKVEKEHCLGIRMSQSLFTGKGSNDFVTGLLYF